MLATAVWFESLCEPIAFGANAQTEVRIRPPSLTGQVVRHRLEPGFDSFHGWYSDWSSIPGPVTVGANSHIGIQAFADRVSPQTEARSRDPKLSGLMLHRDSNPGTAENLGI